MTQYKLLKGGFYFLALSSEGGTMEFFFTLADGGGLVIFIFLMRIDGWVGKIWQIFVDII